MLLTLLLSVMLNLSWDFQVVALERIWSLSGRSCRAVNVCSLRPGRKRDGTRRLGLRGDKERVLAQLKGLSAVLATSGAPWSPLMPRVTHWEARAPSAGVVGAVGTSRGFAGSRAALRRCLPWEACAQPVAMAEHPFGGTLDGSGKSASLP